MGSNWKRVGLDQILGQIADKSKYSYQIKIIEAKDTYFFLKSGFDTGLFNSHLS